MKRYTSDELKEIIRLHALWLADADGGTRANLIGADLIGANLSGADLSGADLSDANLSCAQGVNVIQIGPIGSRRATTTYWIDEDRVQCGCWMDWRGGTLDAFQGRVNKEHANDPRYLAEYNAAIAQFRVAREFRD